MQPRFFQLHKEICMIDQGIQNISVYFSKLNDLWDELESIIPFPACDCDKSKNFTAYLHQQKFMKFLMGLNETYAPQRSQILMMTPTPTLDQAYSMMIQEEIQRGSNGILGISPVEGTHSSLIVANVSNMRPRRNPNTELKCDYCKLKGHTRETCYKLIGYPPGFKFNNNRRKTSYDQSSAHNVMSQEEHISRNGSMGSVFQGLNNDQYLQLVQMMEDLKKKNKGEDKEDSPVDVANMAGPLKWQGEGDW
uniref:Putative ovule protein n=1 Tax=Solanum chacoense TaxID=4108 RepID=A0A0V0HUU3_SOLCH